MERGGEPEHVEDSEDEVGHNRKNYQCLDFTNDLSSNLKIISQG
jgi:hypothetical protein